MNKLSPVLLLLLFWGCHSSSKERIADSIGNKSNSDTGTITLGTTPPDSIVTTPPDRGGDTPNQEEEQKTISENYNNIKKIDSTFINGLDTMKFHLKYYCLKDFALIVPKQYDEHENNKKEFKTHPFVSDIILVRNKDTVLSKQFKASDFTPFFKELPDDNIRKYGSILDLPRFSNGNKDKSKIVLFYSIAIPSTDLGLGMSLSIDKKGGYKIAEIK